MFLPILYTITYVCTWNLHYTIEAVGNTLLHIKQTHEVT